MSHRAQLRGLAVSVGLAASVVAPASAQPADPAVGRRVYLDSCAICHGPGGDGRGHAAAHFATPPRDFTEGRYKIRSTASGQPPTDDDLRRSIVRGLPGTAMIAQDHLAERDLAAVIAFIKSLSPKFASGVVPVPLALPAAPPVDVGTVVRGRKVYDKAECRECHGTEGRGDGPSAKDLKVKPADLTRRPFKGGDTPRDIVRTLLTGLDGTPMPSYHLVLEDTELWELAHYVASIGGPPQTTPDERAAREVVRMHRQGETR